MRVCVAPTVHKLAMEDHIYPVEVIGYVIHFVQELLPHPRLGGPKNWVPDSPNFEFLGKFHKTKVQWRPWKWGDRSDQVPDLTEVSGGGPRCKGGFCKQGPLAVWAWNLADRWGPTQEGQCRCRSWVPLPPGSRGPKIESQGLYS